MKIAIDKSQPSFQQVTISLTFHDQQELDAFGTVCNSSVVLDALYEIGLGGGPFQYEAAAKAGANISSKMQAFHKAIRNHPQIKLDKK